MISVSIYIPNNCLRPFRFCFFLFSVSLDMPLFPGIFVSLPFSLCTVLYGMESTSYVFSFRMVFSTTGWIFDISLCEYSINQTIERLQK